MNEAKQRTRAKDEPAQEARLTAILRAAHARLRLWGKCKDSACSRTETCGGDAAQCGARLAPESWAWLTQVVQAVLRGQPQAAAIDPHVVALAASDWLARALRADRRGKDAVRDDGKERKALV